MSVFVFVVVANAQYPIDGPLLFFRPTFDSISKVKPISSIVDLILLHFVSWRLKINSANEMLYTGAIQDFTELLQNSNIQLQKKNLARLTVVNLDCLESVTN